MWSWTSIRRQEGRGPRVGTLAPMIGSSPTPRARRSLCAYGNKASLEAALQPVIDFQRAYGVHIYIGEFSAIRWAPGDSAARYLSDLIDIFEAHGWDWSYHAFREWSGWSVEHGADPKDRKPAPEPTDRQRLLMRWFGRNQKAAW